jgi:hypothetical protein
MWGNSFGAFDYDTRYDGRRPGRLRRPMEPCRMFDLIEGAGFPRTFLSQYAHLHAGV